MEAEVNTSELASEAIKLDPVAISPIAIKVGDEVIWHEYNSSVRASEPLNSCRINLPNRLSRKFLSTSSPSAEDATKKLPSQQGTIYIKGAYSTETFSLYCEMSSDYIVYYICIFVHSRCSLKFIYKPPHI